MRVAVYPADVYGCGHHRLIWVTQILQQAGHDVRVVLPQARALTYTLENERVTDVSLGLENVDVAVFQRVTHMHLAQTIPLLRAKGIAVVVDVDDDLTAIHPGNAAFEYLHPRNLGKPREGGRHMHSWRVLQEACKAASYVTVSTDSLLTKYAPHGRGSVLRNYLAPVYYENQIQSEENLIGWPASLHNHPNDPAVVGSSIARLVAQGARFRVYGTSEGVVEHFGLAEEPEQTGPVQIADWMAALSPLTVGVCPLADTAFNHSKSWLKPLELAARGVPWVGSPRTEYRKLNAMGCGFLAEKPKEWFGILRRLLADPTMRSDAAEAGRQVAGQLKLEDHAWRWIEAWNEAMVTERKLVTT